MDEDAQPSADRPAAPPMRRASSALRRAPGRGARWHVLVLAAVIAVGAGATAGPAGALELSGTVTSVVDGDTIKVESRGLETPVRLIGIDTPETRHPTKPVQCYGPTASARASHLLPVGQRVRLITDDTQDTRDRYGRLLAYVHKPGGAGAGGSINYSLVNSGHAKVYVYGGVRFQHATAFFKAQHRARKAKRGLWGPQCQGNTTERDPSAPARSRPAPTRHGPRPPSTGTGPCDSNYAGACIPVHPPDLDCTEIPSHDFRVVGQDVHRLDGDDDGIACEG